CSFTARGLTAEGLREPCSTLGLTDLLGLGSDFVTGTGGAVATLARARLATGVALAGGAALPVGAALAAGVGLAGPAFGRPTSTGGFVFGLVAALAGGGGSFGAGVGGRRGGVGVGCDVAASTTTGGSG